MSVFTAPLHRPVGAVAETATIGHAARQAKVYVVIGVVERDPAESPECGSLLSPLAPPNPDTKTMSLTTLQKNFSPGSSL